MAGSEKKSTPDPMAASDETTPKNGRKPRSEDVANNNKQYR